MQGQELTITAFVFNAFSENTYLLYAPGQECLIIDPGCSDDREWEGLRSFVEEAGCKPKAVICTHGHLDHIFGVERCCTAWGIPFWMHPGDNVLVERASDQAAMWGQQMEHIGLPTRPLVDGEHIDILGHDIEVIHTPGHSPGGVCLYMRKERVLFSGDTLFAGSIGRTDIMGGDYGTLIESIQQRLLTLPDDTEVLPGHGPRSTIGRERATNPFLR